MEKKKGAGVIARRRRLLRNDSGRDVRGTIQPLTPLPGRIVRPTLPAGSWNTLHAAGRVNGEWKASLY